MNESMTRLRDPGLRQVTPGGRSVHLAGQSSEQDAPPSLRAAAIPGQPVEGVVHLKGHQSTVHPVEQPLSDLDRDFRIVDGVVDRENQGGAVCGNPKMSVVVSLCPEREQPPTLREVQDLRTALIDPHVRIFKPPTRSGQGRRSSDPLWASPTSVGVRQPHCPLTPIRGDRTGASLPRGRSKPAERTAIARWETGNTLSGLVTPTNVPLQTKKKAQRGTSGTSGCTGWTNVTAVHRAKGIQTLAR